MGLIVLSKFIMEVVVDSAYLVHNGGSGGVESVIKVYEEGSGGEGVLADTWFIMEAVGELKVLSSFIME